MWVWGYENCEGDSEMERRDRIEENSESKTRAWAPSSDGRLGHGKGEMVIEEEKRKLQRN